MWIKIKEFSLFGFLFSVLENGKFPIGFTQSYTITLPFFLLEKKFLNKENSNFGS